MEFLVLLIVVIILILLLSVKSHMSDELRMLDHKLDDLSRRLNELKTEQKKIEKTPEVASRETTPEKIQQATLPPIRPAVGAKTFSPPQPIDSRPQPVHSPPKPVQNKPGFFERNPDLEKFIGENLANKIGIGILVIGIGFFVKYAIDQHWINEIGRVFIGILCGGILLAVAHRLRKSFTAFSSVLVGGGIAVLYFTIAIAFHEYGIFSQTAAFALMVAITGFAVLLSLGYNRVELAVLAILGGFGSPFMVSTGEGNYIVLFTYLLILNSGMLVLAYHKKWRIVNIVCYVFTTLIFAGWLASRFEGDDPERIAGGLIYATLFYLIFFAMNIINNLKRKMDFKAAEIIMLLSNTFLYFSAGLFILNNDIGKHFSGLFTALLAIFNFVFAFSLHKNARVDRKLVFMLIGLVLTFVSLAAPIQLEGNYITLFWAAEAVLLLWLSQKSGITLMSVASVIVTGLMIISLLMDWGNIYLEGGYDSHLAIILNKGYITGAVVVISLTLTRRLLQKEGWQSNLRTNGYSFILTMAAVLLLYLVNLLELRYQIVYYIDSFAAQTVIVGTYNMGYIAMVMLAGQTIALPQNARRALPLLGLFAAAAYLFYYHSFIIEARNEYLAGSEGITGFLFHYLLIGLLIIAVAITLRLYNRDRAFVESVRNGHWWIFIFLFVFIASAELDHTVLLAGYSGFETSYRLIEQSHKIGYPILWGVTSFLLIAIGLSRKIKMLRIISLVLLLITLLKLFVIDLRNISEGGKIAAFISLGVLLLVVSFMYQRLKKLLLDDSRPEEQQTL